MGESRLPDHRPTGTLRGIIWDLLWWCAETLQSAASACLYTAAGLLGPEELRASNRAQWSRFNTTALEVDRGLDPWEQALCDRHLRKGERVLVVGCGAGRDLLALAAQGYAVTGLDHDASRIAEARAHLTRRGLTAPLVVGPVETAPLIGPYDAVALLTCYSGFQQTATRIAILARLRSQLAPGGRILLTYPEFVSQKRMATWVTRGSAWLSGAGWLPEHGDVFSRGYTAPRLLAYQHFFRPEEVARECAVAGLRIVSDDAEDNVHGVAAVVE